MLDGLDSYLADGGRLMYLGGNGFYWVTSAPADDPFVIEVRRGMAGTRVWESPPGEWHQAMTGEHGGIWRHRGRPPQALAGVGFTAQGFDRSLPYRVEAAAAAGRAGFILRASIWRLRWAAPGRCSAGRPDSRSTGPIPPSARRRTPCWSPPLASSAMRTRARSRT